MLDALHSANLCTASPVSLDCELRAWPGIRVAASIRSMDVSNAGQCRYTSYLWVHSCAQCFVTSLLINACMHFGYDCNAALTALCF